MNRRLASTALSLLSLLALHRKLKKKRGVHHIRELRRERGAFNTLWPELKNVPVEFKKYIRMSLSAFEKLLELVKPSLVRNSVREPVSPEQRLVVTLRYLARGNSFTSIAFSFFLGVPTVRAKVHETCEAIRDMLAPMCLRTPKPQAEWKAVADEFFAKWQMPNCLGAVDGKHIMMRAPANSGSLYFNYKGRFSTVLMVVADAGYRILYASVGSYGHESDGGIFADPQKFARVFQCRGCHAMRFNDDFLRRITLEIRLRGRITPANFNAYGSRAYAFAGVAHRLSSADIASDIRRMWHKWAMSFYKYKTRKTARRPKFYYDLHFLDGLTMDHLSSVANRF
ncbi:hypothetical protein AAVH_43481 [Aphelenchoides avenae]|nr:hypothetical protein AAVH_43481 [Aphelenchus avenae]